MFFFGGLPLTAIIRNGGTALRFNQILIVDSLPARQRNTARELYGDVQSRAQVFRPAPEVLYERVESSDSCLALLARLAKMATTQGNVPILHLECHGNEDGLQFADESFVSWLDMKPHLIQLNIATRMNLLVVVSACEGSSIAATLGPVDRAPLHGLIGPTRVVLPSDLEAGYLALYETLLRTRSARDAVQAMIATVPETFVYRAAEWMFQHVWDHYQRTHETPEARLARGIRMARNPPAGYDGVAIDAEVFAELLRQKNREFFDRFRRHFFLCDLYPEHEERFTVRYDNAEV